MVTLMQLWLPILLSAVFVFIASSLIHMVLKWHQSDYTGFSNDDDVRAAVRKGNPAPGMYMFPRCADMKDMGTPEMQAKFTQGPVGFLILRVNGAPNMGKLLGQWFVFCLIVSLFSGCLAGYTLAAGTPWMRVFHVVAAAAFMGYAFGSLPMGIWWGQPWKAVAKDVLDGLIYALITGATFGWLWPA